jgi:hypothetical protein
MSGQKTKKNLSEHDTEKENNIKEETVTSNQSTSVIKPKKVKKNLPLNMLVEVKNGYNGRLIFVSPRTMGLQVVWENFGDVDYVELQELVAARNSSKGFFENNWFLIDDQEVLEFLRVEQYYKNVINHEDFDLIFKKSENEIAETVKNMTTGQKNTLTYRARQLIETGEIDSRKTIDALEKALAVELIERS